MCGFDSDHKVSLSNVYWPFKGGTSFVDILFFFLILVMPLCCLSVYLCLVVTCWEKADLWANVCAV